MDNRTIPQEQQQPLLENGQNAPKTPKTPAQKAIKRTFRGSANLIRLLPTGSVLTFQYFSPILTHQGHCPTHASRVMTLGLLSLCGASCFFLRFTDSLRDEKGKVRNGIATFRGLWVIDKSLKLAPDEAARYKLKFIDFFHAFASILVFAAIALFDKNVVKCFYPKPSEQTRELLMQVPIGIGIACTILFVLFPSKRHGVGCPLSPN